MHSRCSPGRCCWRAAAPAAAARARRSARRRPTTGADTAAAESDTAPRRTGSSDGSSRSSRSTRRSSCAAPAWASARARRRRSRRRCGARPGEPGARVRSDPSAVGIHLLLSDVVPLHVANPDYSKQKRPPTNGLHRPIWANWGFYQQPVPYAYEVHNLEHGGVDHPHRPRGHPQAGHEGDPDVGRLAALPADRPRPAGRRLAARRDGHELAARDGLQDLERAHRARRSAPTATSTGARGPSRSPRSTRARAPPDLPTPVLPDPTA